MDYSVEKLVTAAECDGAVQVANDTKNDLVHRKGNLEHRLSSTEDRATQVATDLAATSAELASMQSIFGTLPEGEVKDDVESRIKRLEYRKWLLEERSEAYGSIAFLEQELEVGRMEKQIAEIDLFIAAVNAHKATL